MRKLLALLLLLVSSPSWGATYYVRENAPSGGNGTSWANAYDSFWNVNRNAKPGDKIYVYEGTYNSYYNNEFNSDVPNPDSAASNPNGNITFIGASLRGDPITDTTIRKDIILPYATVLSGGHIVIKGMNLQGGISFDCPLSGSPPDSCHFDSVSYCHINGGIEFRRAYSCIVYKSVHRGSSIAFNYDGFPGQRTAKNKIVETSLMNLNSGGGLGISVKQETDSCVISRCPTRITIPGPTGGCKPFAFYYGKNFVWEYSLVEIDNRSDCSGPCESGWAIFRDYTNPLTLNADTFLVRSPNCTFLFRFNGNGCCGGHNSGNYTIDSCYFSGDNVRWNWEDWFVNNNNITYTTFINPLYAALEIQGCFSGASKIEYCTFVSGANDQGGSLTDSGVLSLASNATIGCDSVSIYNSLFVSYRYPIGFPGVSICSDKTAGLVSDWDPDEFSTKWKSGRTPYKAGWNFYDIPSYVNIPGDRSIVWRPDVSDSSGGCRINNSLPGNGNLFEVKYPGKDSLSKWGNSALRQGPPSSSTFPSLQPFKSDGQLLFDPRLLPESGAKTSGQGGTSSGAIAYIATGISCQDATEKSFFADSSYADTNYVVITNCGSDSFTINQPMIYNSDQAGSLIITGGIQGTGPSYFEDGVVQIGEWAIWEIIVSNITPGARVVIASLPIMNSALATQVNVTLKINH